MCLVGDTTHCLQHVQNVWRRKKKVGYKDLHKFIACKPNCDRIMYKEENLLFKLKSLSQTFLSFLGFILQQIVSRKGERKQKKKMIKKQHF